MLKESQAAIGCKLLTDYCEIPVVTFIRELKNKHANSSPADPPFKDSLGLLQLLALINQA